MSEQSIKVNIANRVYPLTVDKDEEEYTRKAVKMINDNIKYLEDNYAVKDKQDLLAMTALQYAAKIAEGKMGTSEDENIIEKLKTADKKLTDYLDHL